MRAEVKNAADPEQVEKAGRRVNRRERVRLEHYGAVMRTPAGRAVMWDLLERAGLYETSFDREALIMARREGRRGLGLELLAQLIELEPALYLVMEQEARIRQSQADSETDAAHTAPTTPQENVQ